MTKYNYLEAVKNDVKEYMEENNITEVTEDLYDILIDEDSITGNMSGSYTLNRWQAEENLCHNMDLLKQACDMLGSTPDLNNPEACDVTIRCYLLGDALNEIDEKMNSKYTMPMVKILEEEMN
jgi:hypothetical protein|nr:MAG TPA: hypothetical protein [Caudoviricetes sp.]